MRVGAAIALLVGLALLAGCGGGSGTAASSTPTARATQIPHPGVMCLRMPTKRIAAIVADATGGRPPELKAGASGTPTLLACRYAAPGVRLHVNLDTASRSHRRYLNRVTELAQFGTTKQLYPHPVNGVGDDLGSNAGANWIPQSEQLLTVEGPRYLIVDFNVDGVGNAGLRAGAIALARLAFAKLPRN
jgi:hypothetical protein